MTSYKYRKIQVYDLHLHIDGKAPTNYIDDFFVPIQGIPKLSRVVNYENNTFLAAPEYRLKGGLIDFPLYYGERSSDIVLFDLNRLEEQPTHLDFATFSHKTHVVVNPVTRIAIVEYNHAGAKAKEAAYFLQDLFNQHFNQSCNVSFNPKIDKEFSEGIDKFKIIKQASLTITKPNFDWSDWEDKLTEAASESDAYAATVSMNAGRQESLKKDEGIVEFLKTATSDSSKKSIIENAKVVGFRDNEEAPFTLRLKKHIYGKGLYTKTDEDGRVDTRDIMSKMIDFINELGRR